MPSDIPGGPLPETKVYHDECHLQFPHHYKPSSSSLIIRIDDQQYDLTQWRVKHPGGAEILDHFHMKDATDAFYALHSADAIAKVKKMPSKPVTNEVIMRDDASVKFEALRKKLEREGWFNRDWPVEFARYIIPTFSLVIAGVCLSWTYPLVATLLLGLGMQQAGWLAHDFSHGRCKIAGRIGTFVSAMVNGFSNLWWSNKHNTHHVFPNRVGIDSDIHNDPLLNLWFPPEGKDTILRRYQHIYYPIVYSFLFASWRIQSIQFAFTGNSWMERIGIIISYAGLACLPWYVAIGSILVSGFCVAIVVTANHQPEDMLPKDSKYNYAIDQYITTRGVVCPDFFTEFFFGGMQYQLEHHLFPIMPRSKYAKLRPIVTDFAKELGVEHKLSGIVDILYRNYLVMKAASRSRAHITKVVE